MKKRAMNNTEKTNAKLLKNLGFEIIYQNQYWAINHQLKKQYHLETATDKVLLDITNYKKKNEAKI